MGAASTGPDFDYEAHAERLFQRVTSEAGAQLPSTGRHKGEERHVVRALAEQEGIDIPAHLYEEIMQLVQ